jgi:hypothetical protein
VLACGAQRSAFRQGDVLNAMLSAYTARVRRAGAATSRPNWWCVLLAGTAINILACVPPATAQTCTPINNVTDLQNINENLSGNYCLTQNIDASATAGWNGGAGFVPIGNFTTNFTGTFDGQGHTISNLFVNPATAYDFVGLFGDVAYGGAIANVGLIGGSVSGGYSEVGALVGSNSGTVSRSYATATVSGGSYSESVGGLVGYNFGTVSRSYATGTVSGGGSFSCGFGCSVNSSAAGLVGYNVGTVTQSYATGAVSGSYYVGGLIAYNATGGIVSQSYATGAVNGSAAYSAGGLVGVNYDYVSQSYATGAVSGGGAVIGGTSVGGLVGFNYSQVVQSYATGAVSDASCASCVAGGLVGDNWSDGDVASSYWDTTTTGQASGAGANFGGFIATGLTTAQFQSGLPSGFDPTVWGSNPTVNSGFPYLRWPTLTATPTTGPAPLAVTFTATSLALPMTYTINFGDGTTGALQGSCIGVTAIVSGQGGIQCSGSASHTYTSSGSYPATLLNASSQTLGIATITVTGAAPKVSFAATPPSTPRAGIEDSRIDPSGGIAPPNQAATLGSQTISALQDAMQDVPPKTLEVPLAGSNATVPTISSFTASPASISPFAGGGSATLSWSVVSATSLSISSLGAVTGTSVQVNPSQTTTYILTASNAQGSVTAQTTVTVAGYRWRRADPLSR